MHIFKVFFLSGQIDSLLKKIEKLLRSPNRYCFTHFSLLLICMYHSLDATTVCLHGEISLLHFVTSVYSDIHDVPNHNHQTMFTLDSLKLF